MSSRRRLTSDLDTRRVSRREEAALDTLSPREIQSRLRSGATVAELVEESGMDPAAIERFSGPPLAERAWISEQARSCVVRPGSDDLATLVERHLDGLDGDGLAWDSWRRPDGRWTVVAAVGTDAPVSTWLYDPRSRSVHPDDAASHRIASEDVVVPLRATTSTTSLPRPHDTETSSSTDDDVAPRDDAAPPDDTAAASDTAADTAASDASTTESEPDAPAPARPKTRKGRRASVPRWDEILFGAQESDA
jgi:hypothetical protein